MFGSIVITLHRDNIVPWVLKQFPSNEPDFDILRAKFQIEDPVPVQPVKLTPPQFSVLARSFPVPRGRMATGGCGRSFNWSNTDRIQPT